MNWLILVITVISVYSQAILNFIEQDPNRSHLQQLRNSNHRIDLSNDKSLLHLLSPSSIETFISGSGLSSSHPYKCEILPGSTDYNDVTCEFTFEETSFFNDLTIGNHSLRTLHKNLIEIPSISGKELSVALYLKQVLLAMGLHVHLQKVENNRFNVYGFKGKFSNKKKIFLTSHIDTVPPYIPYSVHDDKIYGRGSCDAKASVVTQIFAYLDMADSLDDDDVALLYVVGEEVDGSGMDKVSLDLNIEMDVVIFGEPTELKLGKGHKGNYMFDLTVNGKASHSGYPELGISASEILIPVLNELLQLDLPKSEILGPSTLNIGQFEGGVAANVIPANASASIFIRVSEDIDTIDKKVKNIVSNVDHLSFNLKQTIQPQYLDYDIPGFDTIILAYATDIPHLTLPVRKRYLYGPGSIHVAHSDNEYVEYQDLLDAVDGYKRLITHILNN